MTYEEKRKRGKLRYPEGDCTKRFESFKNEVSKACRKYGFYIIGDFDRGLMIEEAKTEEDFELFEEIDMLGVWG